MKIKNRFQMILFFLTLFTFSIGLLQAQPVINKNKLVAPIDQTAPDVIDLVVVSNNQFGFQLFHSLKDQYVNFCISPYAISESWAPILDGAKNELSDDIVESLRFTISSENINNAFFRLNSFFGIGKIVGTIQPLAMGNALWLKSNIELLPAYSSDIEKSFPNYLQKTMFNSLEITRVQINDWMRRFTSGKINEFLQLKDLSKNYKMLLISAMILKAKWSFIFEERFSRPSLFFIDESTTITVPTVIATGAFPFYQDDNLSVLQLNYSKIKKNGPELVMLVVLPNDHQGLLQLNRSFLTFGILQSWMKNMSEKLVSVSIPKFKISERMNLTSTFQKMGIHAFDEKADFSGMTEQKGLKIDQIFHQTTISFDEYGSEAGIGSPIPANIKNFDYIYRFKADHPFLFFVVDKVSGAVLFMGKVGYPKTN